MKTNNALGAMVLAGLIAGMEPTVAATHAPEHMPAGDARFVEAQPPTTAEGATEARLGVAPFILLDGPVDILPIVTTRKTPAYPLDARRLGGEGSVLVVALVDESGTVKRVRSAWATDHSFGPAAVAAVRDWRFEPARRSGGAVAVRIAIPIQFRIHRETEALSD